MQSNNKTIKDGVVKSIKNAVELIDDALLLKENNRKERAYTLFQLAIEEIGKALKIFFFLIKKDNQDNFDKFYKKLIGRDGHIEKTKTSIGVDLLILNDLKEKGLKTKELFESTVHEYRNVDKLNDYKNYSLYTSYIDGQFALPSQIINKQLVETIAIRATTRLNIASQFIKFGLDNLNILLAQNTNEYVTMSEQEIHSYANRLMKNDL